MTTTSVSSSSILQQIQSLNTNLQSSSTSQTPAVADFMQALEQVLTAGEEVLSANSSQSSASSSSSTATSTTSSSDSSSSSSTAAANAATVTNMLAFAQAAQPSVYTPTTAWSQDEWDTSAYDAANNAASSGASQTVNGVQIIPGAAGWDANSTQLQSIYSGIQSTWDNQANALFPQSSQSAAGPYGWANSAYNAANSVAAQGGSQTVDGVQVIPGAPGWEPNNSALQGIYAGMQGTWNSLNNMTSTSS